ncbi:MAG: nucleotide exchange factor GrpE [Microcoleaceae cyanobacterium]|jgi:molecular chaperone GrpE
MIDEEKQQEHESPSGESSPEVGQVSAETSAPEATTSPEVDWELQVAQAYRDADVSQAPTPSASAGDSLAASPGLAEAMEFLKGELTNATQENQSLKAQLKALDAQIEDLKSQNLRLAADFDNFRKRTQKEKEELDLQSRCSTIIELLPVIDNFERARAHIKPQNDGEMDIHKSYQSVYKQMVDCLKRIGVSPMRPEGQPFDPNLHEAVMREATDQYEEGSVIEEFQRGYLLGDRVLRHSLVKVATAPEPTESDTETPAEVS